MNKFPGFILLFILSNVFFTSNNTTAQVIYYVPIDSIRADSVAEGFERYSIIIDSIGTDGYFYNGYGIYNNPDSPTHNYKWFKANKYDVEKRKIKSQVWTESNGIIRYSVNETFNYNQKGLLAKYSNVTTSFTNEVNFEYNEFDSLLLKIAITTQVTTNSVSGEKYDFEYSSDKKIQQSAISMLDSGVWVQTKKNRYSYSNTGSPDTVLTYNKFSTPLYRLLRYKNGEGKDTLTISQIKDQVNGLWNTTYYDFYHYDSLGNVIQHDEWLGAPVNDDYVYGESWNYNSLGQLLFHQVYYFGGGGNYTSYSYYPNGRVKSYYYSYGGSMGDWETEAHYYSYYPVKIPEVNAFDFLIYPNPAVNKIEVLTNFSERGTHTFMLYNSIGQLIINESLEIPMGYYSLQISLNAISKGLYFLSISDGNVVKTKKVNINR